MKRYLLAVFTSLVVTTATAQSVPVFNGKQLIDVGTVSSWNFASRPAGWYRIGVIYTGGRGNACFELRENADHSTLRFEIGINFNNRVGSSVTITNHSYWYAPTFKKIRVLSNTTYDNVFLEVFVDPHNNDNSAFYAYLLNPLADDDWLPINWTQGAIPSGYTSSEFDVNQVFTAGTLNQPNALSVNRSGNVGIGTANASSYKLAVAGSMIAESVKVKLQSAWPDFVFAKSYMLPSLEKTQQHIKEKGHLPDIPSASEVKEKGIDLGEMNAKLLQKIEELTLHLIEMKKENEIQNKRLDQQSKALLLLNYETNQSKVK